MSVHTLCYQDEILQSELSALEEHKVLVGVSASGLLVLDADNWSVLFGAACWDVQECSVSEVSVAVKKPKPKGMSQI